MRFLKALLIFLFFFSNSDSNTFMLFENIKGDSDRTEFIDSVYNLIKKHDKVELFLYSNSLKKVTSIYSMFKACHLAIKVLETDFDNDFLPLQNKDGIKIISFGRTFNIVFLASLLLDDKAQDLLVQNLDGKPLDLSCEKPFSFTPKDRIFNLREKFKLMFEEYERKAFPKGELDFIDEKGLQDVLFLDEFNELFKFCREKITSLKKNKDISISNVVTLLAPNDRVYITIDKKEKEVETNQFYFKPSHNSIERIINLYSEDAIGKLFLGDQMLQFEDLLFNFLNVGIMNSEIDIIKNSVIHYLFDCRDEKGVYYEG